MSNSEEYEFIQWSIVQAEKLATYEAYSENLKRAIKELELFYYPSHNKKVLVSKLKDVFIRARKNDYRNNHISHQVDISDEEFITALEYWNLASINFGYKIYFKCRLNPEVSNVFDHNEKLFVFQNENYEYNNINFIECEICGSPFDKTTVCSKTSTKKHQYHEWIMSHNADISYYNWNKMHNI